MKPWLGLGLGSISILPALVVGALATSGCSSSSSPPAGPGPGGGGDGGGGDAGTPGSGPLVDGGGASCPANAHETVAAKVTLTVTWPATLANAGCDKNTKPNPCTGDIEIWLLAHYDFTGGMVTGTTETCGNQTPPIPLSSTGSLSEGLPAGTQGTVQVNFLPSVWTSIIANPNVPPTQTSGVIGGWGVGSSFQINPTNSVYGLSPTSMYASASTIWPASESDISPMDITDDDKDGHPGITATPASGNGFVLPATAALMTPPTFADKLYLTLRTSLSLYGLSSTCTDLSGTVGVQTINNHVIGCELANDAGDCSMAQWDFIDSNSTVYVGPGVTIPASAMPASYTPQKISGTFTAKILSTDPDGGSIGCSDVLTAFPAQ
jgi:hypothetical protein